MATHHNPHHLRHAVCEDRVAEKIFVPLGAYLGRLHRVSIMIEHATLYLVKVVFVSLVPLLLTGTLCDTTRWRALFFCEQAL